MFHGTEEAKWDDSSIAVNSSGLNQVDTYSFQRFASQSVLNSNQTSRMNEYSDNVCSTGRISCFHSALEEVEITDKIKRRIYKDTSKVAAYL